jgi:23S rRNA pseudouridine2457 synthase
VKHRYILLNKPYDVLCQFSGEGRTLADYVRVPDVYPVGRLDRDSEGVVLLTSDGALQHRMSDPKFGHPRTYWAQVEGVPEDEALARLRSGVDVQDYRTRPARVRVIEPPDVPPRDPPIRYRKSIPTTWIELILTEGRNRQVRRMTAAVGYPTLRLIRYAIGPLTLEGLQPGEWRELSSDEVRRA